MSREQTRGSGSELRLTGGAFLALALALGGFILALVPAGGAEAAPGTVNGKIAFLRLHDLYVMNADGTNKTNLSDSKALEAEAVFSPDGSKIAFVRTPVKGFISTGKSDIWVMNADGSGAVKVTNVADRIESPVWAADGATIFYLADRDGTSVTSEIYAVKADGSGETQLYGSAASIDGGATLSSAAGKLAFAGTEPDGSSEIYIINGDGSGLLRLTNDPGADDHPALSASGTRIAWTTDRHNPAGEFSTAAEIYAANSDGSAQQRLTAAAGVTNLAVAFSPDETKIGFDRNLSASVMNADGTARVQLLPGETLDFFEQFSANGQRVAISHILPLPGEDPHYTIQTANLDGSGRRILTTRADDAVFSDWQAASVIPPNPPLTLEAAARKAQPSESLRASIACSNECELELKAKGKAAGKSFRSAVSSHLYGDEPTKLRPLKRKVRKRIAGKRGMVTIKIEASDDFGASEAARLKVRLKR